MIIVYNNEIKIKKDEFDLEIDMVPEDTPLVYQDHNGHNHEISHKKQLHAVKGTQI